MSLLVALHIILCRIFEINVPSFKTYIACILTYYKSYNSEKSLSK